MANGIDDLFQQEDQGGGITDIVIEKGKTEAAIKAKEVIDSIDQTGFLSSQIDPIDLRNIGEALAAGDTEKLAGIFYNEVDQLQQNAPAAVVSALGLSSNPLGNAIAAGELANNAVQKFAETSDMISGIDIPGDNVFSTGVEGALDFINKPIQIGADMFGTGITGISGDYGNMMSNLIYNTPYYKFMADQAAKPFDLLYNIGLPSFFDRDKKPDPPAQLTNDQINQIVKDEEDLTKPPVVINQPSPQQDFPIINQGGGQGGNQGGGGNVVIGSSFTPPSTNVQQETSRIRDILDRRAQGSSQGFNSGGLATVSRYLKGR
jgi:hypothetical protein